MGVQARKRVYVSRACMRVIPEPHCNAVVQDMVSVLVKMNRCQYAQLAQQQFEAPRGYPMPLPSSSTYRSADLGMRLTCGFEMMYANRTRFGAPPDQAMDADDAEASAPAAKGRDP